LVSSRALVPLTPAVVLSFLAETIAVAVDPSLWSSVMAVAMDEALTATPVASAMKVPVATEGVGSVSAGVLVPLTQAVVKSFPAVGLASDVEEAWMAALARPASAAMAGASWWEIVESIVGAERVPAADGSRVSTACADLASTGRSVVVTGIPPLEELCAVLDRATDALVADRRELEAALARRVAGMATHGCCLKAPEYWVFLRRDEDVSLSLSMNA